METIIRLTIKVNRKPYDVYITCDSTKKQIEVPDDRHVIIYGKVPMIVKNKCRQGYEMFLKMKTEGDDKIVLEFKSEPKSFMSIMQYKEDKPDLAISIDVEWWVGLFPTTIF